MPKWIDNLISPLPIRIADLKVDRSRLRMQSFIVFGTGHLPGRHSRRIQTEFNNWAFAYIANGKGNYQVKDGPVQQVVKGDLFFVYPDEVFSYGPAIGSSWEEFYITFEGKRINEMEKSGLVVKGAVKSVGTDPIWRQRLETVISLIESGVPANADRASMLVESLLFEFSLMDTAIQKNNKMSKWDNILDELFRHTYDLIDPDAIAKRLSLSIPTLRRTVSLNTGYPLNEYIHRLKVSEAKKLLVNTKLSIKEIALMLHYDDVYYFSRLFKKFTESSPRSFRENL